jgi:hypothetical protein
MKIQWMRYKSYSGAKIRGTAPVLPPEGADRASHMQRAFYLTAMLESPTWGSVQSYDGAGMSGGPLHNIAVHPHAKGRPQGSLWGLVRDIEKSSGALVEPLYEWLGEFGWYVASDAKVRQLDTGVLVPGEELRIALSGSGSVQSMLPDYFIRCCLLLVHVPRSGCLRSSTWSKHRLC